MNKPTCTAKSKRSQQQCKRRPTPGRTVCRFHGGKSLGGIASPSFTHGKYFKYLPTRMLSDYEKTKNDPHLLDLSDDIAVMHARAADLMRCVDDGKSGHLWKQLKAAYAALQAVDTRDVQLAAIADLGRLITQGAADYAAWEELGRTLDRKQRLVESQRKRAEELEHNMPLDQLKFILSVYTDAVVKHVTNRDTRAAIQAEFNRVVYLPPQ